MRLRFILLLIPVSVGFCFQIPTPSLSGDFGVHWQYEHNSDTIRQRNPSSGYYLMLNTLLNWFSFNADLNLLYSSDDKFTAQKINRFNLNLNPAIPSWRWVKLHLGDFAPTLSAFTLSGTPISGAGLELAPGHWRFNLINGESRRNSKDPLNWSYRRGISAFRLGSEYMSLILLKVKDDTSSLESTDTIIPVRPQENLVLGLASNFMIANILSFDVEGTGSAHTRDLRNDTIYLAGLPGFAYSFYTPRHSSHLDFALRGTLNFKSRFALLSIGFQQVGPGFTSLGLPYLKNDLQKWSLGVAIKSIPKTDIRIGLEKEYDNLIKDKLATTKTDNLNLSVIFSPFPLVNIVGNYNQKKMQKVVRNDNFSLNSLSHVVSFMPNFNFGLWGINQNLMAVVNYQDHKDRMPLSQTPVSSILSIGVNFSITPKIPVTFNTAFSQTYNLSLAGQINPESYNSYGLTANRALLKDKLKNCMTFNFQPSILGNNYSLNGNHSYSLTKRDILNFVWYLGLFSSAKQSVNNFNLQMVQLNYTRRI